MPEHGRITWPEYWLLRVQNLNQLYPCQDTALGYAIGIHGGGVKHDCTLGCIALKSEDVDKLYDLVPLGTPVEILP